MNTAIEDFFSYFLCALVVRGKREIYRGGAKAEKERLRMCALYSVIDQRVLVGQEKRDSNDRAFVRILENVRMHLLPGVVGSFERLYATLTKISWMISTDAPHVDGYSITISPDASRKILDHADPRMRELIEAAADAYVADLR